MVGAYINSITPKVIAYEKEPVSFPIIIEARKTWTDESIRAEIHKDAVKYGVKESAMIKTIECESFSSTTLQSKVIQKDGTRENSWGISQINLDFHPDITKEQALDPEFALDFMAKMFSTGHADRWSCYRNIFLK